MPNNSNFVLEKLHDTAQSLVQLQELCKTEILNDLDVVELLEDFSRRIDELHDADDIRMHDLTQLSREIRSEIHFLNALIDCRKLLQTILTLSEHKECLQSEQQQLIAFVVEQSQLLARSIQINHTLGDGSFATLSALECDPRVVKKTLCSKLRDFKIAIQTRELAKQLSMQDAQIVNPEQQEIIRARFVQKYQDAKREFRDAQEQKSLSLKEGRLLLAQIDECKRQTSKMPSPTKQQKKTSLWNLSCCSAAASLSSVISYHESIDLSKRERSEAELHWQLALCLARAEVELDEVQFNASNEPTPSLTPWG